MLQFQDFKQEYFQVLQNQPEILDWLNQDILHGIWYANLKVLNKIWVNDAFWKTLNYSVSDETEYNKALNNILKGQLEERVELFLETVKNNPDKQCGTTTNYKDGNGKMISLKNEGYNILDFDGTVKAVIIKFKRDLSLVETDLVKEINILNTYNQIYEETNEVARVGGWNVSMDPPEIYWSKVTKDIHEVDQDFVPEREGAINFFKEGWSRELITKVFTECAENGTSYNEELKMITAKGREIWVRAFGKAEFKGDKCLRLYGAFQDINEKKLREIELQKSRERFEKVFNNSSIGIVLVNSQSELQMINDTALDIFELHELGPHNLMGMSYKDFVHPDYLDEMEVYRKKLYSGEIDKYKMVSKFKTAKGNHIWCNINTSIVRSNDDSDDLIITQVEDITEIKNLEKESRENALKFRNVFEYSPNGMGVVTFEGDWLMANKKLAEMIGYTKEELLKLSFNDITHPDDLRNDVHFLIEMMENKRDSYSIQKRYIHKNGQIVHGYLNVSSLRDEAGNITSLVGHFVDLTQQIKAECDLKRSFIELQALLDATTQVSIIETDLNGYARKFNKGAENLLGYTAKEMIGNSVAILHEESEIAHMAQKFFKKYNAKISGFDVFVFEANQGHYSSNEWTYIRKDGSKFPVQLVVTAIRDSSNKITGYLGVATDISELKAMESSLVEEKIRAETANKSKSEFLANMSHEIRTPLNGIIGFTDLLLRTKLSEDQARYMQMVNNSSSSLFELVNDILDFSKIEVGKLELDFQKTNLNELCGQVIDVVKHQAHSKGLEILLNISVESRKSIFVDDFRLRQILTNLLGNAVKFTNEGEVELKVELTATSNDPTYVNYKFSIRDTGVGIAPNNLKKVFNAFDQEDGSTTRKYGGTGLGLAISNNLLKLMDSELQVTSKVGEGSTFYFNVKIKTETEEKFKTSGKGKIKNVLIVDDNTTNCLILKDMLAIDNINSTLVGNGVDAIDLLSNSDKTFDMAIIDYNMPYLNGIELIRHIRNELKLDGKKLPIIFLNSSLDDVIITKETKGLDLKANIVKPIRINPLFDIISKIQTHTDGDIKEDENIDTTNLSNLKCNILIAEDNPVNKFLSKTIVKKVLPNCNIFEANDGYEAIGIYKKEDIDLILMDIQMPNLSGYQATEIIREQGRDGKQIPIIALTARTLKGEKERCEEHGMNDYITKPVVLKAIKNIIIEYIVNINHKNTIQ